MNCVYIMHNLFCDGLFVSWRNLKNKKYGVKMRLNYFKEKRKNLTGIPYYRAEIIDMSRISYCYGWIVNP